MATGTVKWYNDVKGFGFISSEEGADVFVHRSGITGANKVLREGQKVKFETKRGEKGLVAVGVTVIG